MTEQKKFRFVSRIKGTRNIEQMSADGFAVLVDKCGKTPGFTYQEYLKPEGGREILVRPFYDWDAKYVDKPADLEAHEKKHANEFARTVARLHPGSRVIYAKRHGDLDVTTRKKKGMENDSPQFKYKISYRAFVVDAVMNLTDIPTHVRTTLGLDAKATHENLDLSVYKSREQLLAVLYGTKDTDVIKRYLVPIRDPLEADGDTSELPKEAVDVREYLVQNVTEGAKMVTVAAGAVGRGQKTKGNGKKGKAEPTKESNDAHGLGGRSILTRANYAAALDAASDYFGEKYRMQEALQSVIVDPSTRSLTFPTEKKWCFIRRNTHQSNNPYIIVTERGARFKCPDEECAVKEKQPHIPLAQLPVSVRDLFQAHIVVADKDHETVGEAREICKRTIVDLYSDEKVEDLSPCKALDDEGRPLAKFITDLSQQRCHYCKELMVAAEHSLQGICLRCKQCGKKWPKKGFITALNEEEHPKLFVVLNNWNLQQNVSVVVNNNYGTVSEEPLTEFQEDGLRVFEDDNRNACFLRALQGTDSGLSGLVFELFRDSFHCSQAGNKGTDGMWFEFREHHWVDKAELYLRKNLSSDELFIKYFRHALHFYERDSVQTEETKRKARAIKRLIDQIGDGGRRKRILEDAIILFHGHRPRFSEELDTANMLVFTNGVVDLDKFEFRDGRPEDVLSIQLSFAYQPQDAQSAECAYVMDFMDAIQPDPDTRDYLLTVLSLCLTTDTSMQYFWIMTGAGANGKSKLMNLLADTLGDHFGAAPAALLTRRREDANQANEALSQLQKARVAVFSEGSAAEVIQVNTVKLFTGEDAISTRGLHEKQQRWRPVFKCFLVCNDIPKIDDNSWAGWRRFKVVSFEVQFVDEPQLKHERKKDPEVGKRLAKCTGAFAGILVEYLRRFKVSGLKESEQVIKATQSYQTDNDLMEEFRENQLVENDLAALKATDACKAFHNWAVKKGRRAPENKKAIMAMFEAKFGPTKPIRGFNYSDKVRGWKGLMLET